MDFVSESGLLALGSRLRRLSDRIMQSGHEIYRAIDIDFEPRWFPLYRLLAERGPLNVGECARQLGLSHAAVSQMAKPLMKKGLVASRKDKRDERRSLLELTDQGWDILPKMRDIWADIEAGVRDAVDFGGVDILAALQGIEQAFDIKSLDERVAEHHRNRHLEEVDIVDYRPEYKEYFKNLNLEWLEKYFSVEPIDREVLWHPEVILDDGGVILFAKIGDEVVGTCSLQKQGDKWELTKMAVTEAHQGKKIGKKLMQATLDRARAMGLKELYLVTNSGLTAAVNLYRKIGFRVTSCEQHPKYQRGDLTMEMSLA